MSERLFAFGTNETEKAACPATTAGYNPTEHFSNDPWYSRIADQYDLYVALDLFEMCGGDIADLNDAAIHYDLRERGFDQGVVPEHIARRCWRRAWEVQAADHEGLDVEEALGWVEA